MTEQILSLDEKTLMVALKHKKGTADLCKRYCCDKATLEGRIRQVYKRHRKKCRGIDKSESIIRELEENDSVSTTAASKNLDETVVSSRAEVPLEEECFQEEATSAEENTQEETIPEEVAQKETIESLMERENVLTQEAIELDVRHKQVSAENGVILEHIRVLINEAEGFVTQYKATMDKIYGLGRESDAKVAQMNEISAEYNAKINVLKSVHAKIEEMKRIVLYVYADGTIIDMNRENEYKVEDSELSETMMELFGKDECQELKMREIRILAKLVILAGYAEPDPVEILFDESAEMAEIKKAFDALHAAGKATE